AGRGSPPYGLGGGNREGGGGGAPGGESQRRLARHPPRPKRRADHGRPGPFTTSVLEPALERRKVHEPGRARRGQIGTRRPVRSDNRQRHWTGAQTGMSALRVRPLSAGRAMGRTTRRRPRARTLADATTGRDARRQRGGGERGRGKRRDLHRQTARPRRLYRRN